MSGIKAVIFDMDGVIFDSESIWQKKTVEANEKFGIDVTEEVRIGICGKNENVIREELKKLYPDFDTDIYREYVMKEVLSALNSGNFEVKKGFDTLISYLKEKKLKIALATSSDSVRGKNMFKNKGYDIDKIFDATVFGEETGKRSKPDPFIFQLAAKKLGVDASECIVIEDSLNGIKAASAGGFKPVMVIDIIKPDDFCKENCMLISDNLEELKNKI